MFLNHPFVAGDGFCLGGVTIRINLSPFSSIWKNHRLKDEWRTVSDTEPLVEANPDGRLTLPVRERFLFHDLLVPVLKICRPLEKTRLSFGV